MKDLRSEYSPMAARDYQAQRQMTVGDLLLDNRIIFLLDRFVGLDILEYTGPAGVKG